MTRARAGGSVKAQPRALGDLSRSTRATLGERQDESSRRSGQPRDMGGCAIDHRRRRLPGEALIELEAGVGLGDVVPVRHRIGIVVAWGRPCAGKISQAGEPSQPGKLGTQPGGPGKDGEDVRWVLFPASSDHSGCKAARTLWVVTSLSAT